MCNFLHILCGNFVITQSGLLFPKTKNKKVSLLNWIRRPEILMKQLYRFFRRVDILLREAQIELRVIWIGMQETWIELNNGINDDLLCKNGDLSGLND
jgi:hypothetical protein